MLAAVINGDVKELAELMRQDPGFDVNLDHGDGFTLLHYACVDSSSSPVIPLLLAHPDIDVNVKDIYGWTPFFYACYYGHTSCVREMLKDFRVKVNEPAKSGQTPLWYTAYYGHLDNIKWWIAYGREMDLGKPGDIGNTDAIGAAKKNDLTEVVTLLERFKENPEETRHAVRVELGLVDAEMFALVVIISDGLLSLLDFQDLTPSFFSFLFFFPFLNGLSTNRFPFLLPSVLPSVPPSVLPSSSSRICIEHGGSSDE